MSVRLSGDATTPWKLALQYNCPQVYLHPDCSQGKWSLDMGTFMYSRISLLGGLGGTTGIALD